MVRFRRSNHPFISFTLVLIFIMKVKIDTREKFHVITFEEAELSANMSANLHELLSSFLQKQPKNVVLNFKDTTRIEPEFLEALVQLQSLFYEQSASFVLCELPVSAKSNEWTDTLNITPTESEAWDIVQMEEIERELFNDDLP